MQRTQSPQQLSQVQMAVNGGIVEVWLHRNIEQVTDEDGNAAWVADQVHGILPASTTGAYVAAHFDELWDEWDDTPLVRRIAGVRETAQTQADAIDDLAWLASDTDANVGMVMDAIADLGADVSALYEFVGGGE